MLRVRMTREAAFFVAGLITLLAGVWCVETIDLTRALSGGPDEGVWLGSARLLNHGYPFSSFFFNQFSLFPQILAVALRLGGDSVLTGRLTITYFSIGALLALALLTRMLSTRTTALLAVLFTAANHYYLEQSRFVQAEVPSIALMLWALVAIILYTRQRHRTWLVVSAIACTASVVVKPLTIGLALPLVWWLGASHIVRQEKGYHIEWRELGLDVLILTTAGILTAQFFVNVFDLAGEYQRTVGFHFEEVRLWAPRLMERLAGLYAFLAENRGWLGISLLGALIAAWKVPGRVLPLLLAECASAALILQLSPARHYYTILVPVLAFCAASGVTEGLAALWATLNFIVPAVSRGVVALRDDLPIQMSRLRQVLQQEIAMRRLAWASGLIALTFVLAFAIWIHDAPQLVRYDEGVLRKGSHDTRMTVLFLQQHTTPGDFLISDDPMVVFRAGCLIPPTAINLVYPSTFRFFAGSDQKLAESVHDYNVKAFVVLGPYVANVDLMQWIAANYPVERPAGQAGATGSALTFWREWR